MPGTVRRAGALARRRLDESLPGRPREAADLPTAPRSPRATPSSPSARATAAGGSGRRWEAPAGTAVLCSILFRPDLDARPASPRHLGGGARRGAGVPRERRGRASRSSGRTTSSPCAESGAAQRGRPGTARASGRSRGLLSEVVRAAAERFAGWPWRPSVRRAVVVGIGINVNWPADWPPADSKDPELRLDRGPGDLAEPPRGTRDRPQRPRRADCCGIREPGTRCSPATRDASALASRVPSPLRPRSGARSASSSRDETVARARRSTSTTPGACSSRPASASGSRPATSSTSVSDRQARWLRAGTGHGRGRRLAWAGHATARHRRCRLHRFEFRPLLGCNVVPMTSSSSSTR